MSTSHSAAASMLGYLYQVRMALLLALRGDEGTTVRVEGLDDIVTASGDSTNLYQSKHSVGKAADLGNTSANLWKSLRVWADHLAANKFSTAKTRLFLLTTSTPSPSSIAYTLTQLNRDNEKLVAELVEVAEKSESSKLAPAFQAFLSLSEPQKLELASSIRLLSGSPTIVDCSKDIRNCLSLSVRTEHLTALIERLEGWWFNRVVSSLVSNTSTEISRDEIGEKVVGIADYYRPGSLPIDFLRVDPAEAKVSHDKLFVQQLVYLDVNAQRIEAAILDYYKAFEQRSKWVREELLVDDELESYEQRLVDEWSRFRNVCLDEISGSSVEEMRQLGLRILKWMELEADIRIRPKVDAAYVMRGSFHMLADTSPEPRVWWHPHFTEKLKKLIAVSGS